VTSPAADRLRDDPAADEIDDGICVRMHGSLAEVVLARPERRNALDLAMWERIRRVFASLDEAEELRVIVLRGAGGHLSAGSDISHFPEHRTGIAAADRYNAAIAAALEAVMRVRRPVVAMIAGRCVGGGCELACASDVRIASAEATLGVPIARLGVSIGPVEARALLNVISPGRLKELLLTGRILDAQEALQLGLVDRVVPPDELSSATWALAEEIAAGAPLAAMANKLTVDAVATGTLAAAEPRLRELTVAIYEGADLQEGIRAFVEKRPPRFAAADRAARSEP
jgi:enoyl-CoA hydratase/carnithine racemase